MTGYFVFDGRSNAAADEGMNNETATLLRRISFEGNGYFDSGWSKEQIEV